MLQKKGGVEKRLLSMLLQYVNINYGKCELKHCYPFKMLQLCKIVHSTNVRFAHSGKRNNKLGTSI